MTVEFETGQPQETVLYPDLPICDAHHHLGNRPDMQYMVGDLLNDANSGHRILKTVYVDSSSGYHADGPEAFKPVGETAFVIDTLSGNKVKTNTEIAAGIVGHADLALGKQVEPVLEAHLAAGKGRFRGIRHTCAWDADPNLKSYINPPKGLMETREFRDGFACLRKHNLSFDAWIYFRQLTEMVDLARAFPDTSIILNHLGGPIFIGAYSAHREAVIQEWRNGIGELAKCDNVFVKLGGFGIRLWGFDWSKRDVKPDSQELASAALPYCLWCIESFGVERCMFESNFPIDKPSYSYAVVWNAFKRITQNLSGTERLALFYETAVRAYRL